MRADRTAVSERALPFVLRLRRVCRLQAAVERSQFHGREQRGPALAQRELYIPQMILEGQRGEQISLDIDLAAKVRLGEAQRVASEHHRDHGRRRAEPQRKRWLDTHPLSPSPRRARLCRNAAAHAKRGPAPESYGNAHVQVLEYLREQLRRERLPRIPRLRGRLQAVGTV